MNIGFNPTQFNQEIPGYNVGGGVITPKTTGKTKPAEFGELLLKKFEATGEVSSSQATARPGNIVADFISEVNSRQKVAADTRTAFLAGESGNLHQTMIASQEASVSFTLMVEMRNKVLEAYQELMRIQI